LKSIMQADDLSGVELRHLRALVAIAETSSFSMAARRLGYAQSAVSQQIAALERIVGTRLVDRPGGPRAVALTEAGVVLAGHANRMLARLSAARADLAALAAGEAGTLRIGTFQSAGARILPDVLSAFRVALPRVALRIVEEHDEARLLEHVTAGDVDVSFVDVALIGAGAAGGDFTCVDLVLDAWVLLAPPDSDLPADEPVPLARLHGAPLLAWSHSSSIRVLLRELESRGIAPEVVFNTDDNLTLQRLVGAGLGFAVMPGLAVEHGVEAGPALIREIRDDLPPRRIGLVWRAGRVPSRALDTFVAAAREVVGQDAPAASERGA
jgi:DNA-binding transcriptional LysR family regulator